MKKYLVALFLFICAATFALTWNPIAEHQAKSVATPLFQNFTSNHHYDRQLRASMRNFQERTGISIGILLLEMLPPSQSIEQYAAETMSQLRLGSMTQGKGLLYLWAKEEDQFKIEVSYSLEHIFPDAVCRRLESGARTFMASKVPYAQRDFLAELMVTMGIQYLEYKKNGNADDIFLTTSAPGRLSGYLSGGAGMAGSGYASILENANSEISLMSADQQEKWRPDAHIEMVLQRYMASLETGSGDPNLPLITEGSKFFRLEKPLTPGYLQRIYRYMVSALPYKVIEQGDRAAVMFSPGHPVLPVLLRKDPAGLWSVDEAAAWAEFQLSDDGRLIPKYSQSPYAFSTITEQISGSMPSLYGNRAKVPNAKPYATGLVQRIRKLETEIETHPKQPEAYQQLAEIMHYDLFWLSSAALLYEMVVALQPDRVDMHWRLVDIYRNMEEIDAEAKHYSAILRLTPADATAQQYFDWLKQTFEFPK